MATSNENIDPRSIAHRAINDAGESTAELKPSLPLVDTSSKQGERRESRLPDSATGPSPNTPVNREKDLPSLPANAVPPVPEIVVRPASSSEAAEASIRQRSIPATRHTSSAEALSGPDNGEGSSRGTGHDPRAPPPSQIGRGSSIGFAGGDEITTAPPQAEKAPSATQKEIAAESRGGAKLHQVTKAQLFGLVTGAHVPVSSSFRLLPNSFNNRFAIRWNEIHAKHKANPQKIPMKKRWSEFKECYEYGKYRGTLQPIDQTVIERPAPIGEASSLTHGLKAGIESPEVEPTETEPTGKRRYWPFRSARSRGDFGGPGDGNADREDVGRNLSHRYDEREDGVLHNLTRKIVDVPTITRADWLMPLNRGQTGTVANNAQSSPHNMLPEVQQPDAVSRPPSTRGTPGHPSEGFTRSLRSRLSRIARQTKSTPDFREPRY